MNLKKFVAVLAIALATAFVAQAKPGALEVKAGDAVYVCGCEKCGCQTTSLKAGKCNCNHDLTKVTVSKIEGKKAFYEVDGKQKPLKTTGKYSCACGAECCQMISQKPGKCVCGKDLAVVEKKKE